MPVNAAPCEMIVKQMITVDAAPEIYSTYEEVLEKLCFFGM
jgi:hypothetical protein